MASQMLLESDRSEIFFKAMKDIREGGLSTRKAAQKWGVKKTTLQDWLSRQLNYDRQKGPPSVLTKTEENQFADWLIGLSNRGFGLSKNAFRKSVKKVLDKDGRATPFKNNKPANKWFRSAVKRNPKVKVRKAWPLEILQILADSSWQVAQESPAVGQKKKKMQEVEKEKEEKRKKIEEDIRRKEQKKRESEERKQKEIEKKTAANSIKQGKRN